MQLISIFFFFSSRRRHTRLQGDWSSDVCSSDLRAPELVRDLADPLLLGEAHHDDAVLVRGELADEPEELRALRSEEHTSELQSPCNLVCRLLLEKKKKK